MAGKDRERGGQRTCWGVQPHRAIRTNPVTRGQVYKVEMDGNEGGEKAIKAGLFIGEETGVEKRGTRAAKRRVKKWQK